MKPGGIAFLNSRNSPRLTHNAPGTLGDTVGHLADVPARCPPNRTGPGDPGTIQGCHRGEDAP